MGKFSIQTLKTNNLTEEIYSIFSPLEDFDSEKIQVFIHGSWADDTRTSFSDLDDFIIVDDNYFLLAEPALKAIEYTFQKIDPIQHHGHWIIKKSQLLDYDNSYLPLFILKESICIKGENVIEGFINNYNYKKGTIERIKNTCRNIELFYDQYKQDVLNVYDLKRLVSSFLLIQPLLFQLQGKNINKKKAIEFSIGLYSNQAFQAIKWATDFRINWGQLQKEESYRKMYVDIRNYNDAQIWRNYIEKNAPIIKANYLSEIDLNDEIIDLFIKETLQYIYNEEYQNLGLSDYEKGYKKIEQYAIEIGAILVGQFGNIKYPSISDLDVFICFEDHTYKNNCEKVLLYIQNDSLLSYLFTHTPFFSSWSMLDKMKYLHTLYDLSITFNPKNIIIDNKINMDYLIFLNMVWAYSFMPLCSMPKNEFKYIGIRKLLMNLKNLHFSIQNIEQIRELQTSPILNISDRIRILILKEGISARNQVENEFEIAQKKLLKLLNDWDLDSTFFFFKKIWISADNYFQLSNKTQPIYKNGKYIFLVNKIYFKLILDILLKRSKEAKLYYETLVFYRKNYQSIGGYINTHIQIIPETCISENYHYWKVQIFIFLKKIKRFIKRSAYKFRLIKK